MILFVIAWLGFQDTPDFAARFAKIAVGMQANVVRASLGAPSREQTSVEADAVLSKADGVLLRDDLRFDEHDRLQAVNTELAPDGSDRHYDWPRLRDVKYRDALAARFRALDALRGHSLAEVSAATLAGRTVRTAQVWLYLEDRPPRVGETMHIYEITLAGGKVARTRLVMGPDATGPNRAR